MIYLLDTNTVIARLNGNLAVSERLAALEPEEVVLCAPVLAELHFGASLSARREQNLGRLERLADGMRFQPFDAGAARRFGDLKASLRRRGITKSDFDLAIAAIALQLDAILVSEDGAFHDGSIAKLQTENWLAGGE
ncbi:MAG TPA: PIN domain-containing protein [Thermoanaerobaculia bacterium]|nr:PIN domain-containing protein [Thermoanaerobaculia bacterium]